MAEMKTVKSLDVGSVAKIQATIFAAMYALGGALTLVFSLIGPLLGFEGTGFGVIVALGAMIVGAIVGFIIGYIAGALGAFIYNIVAGKVGGIKVELE